MPRPDTPQRRPGQQRRGEELRRHILTTAKDVFLQIGFERTSMDAVAAAAGTSKRSLYAHFENKDALFVAVLDLVRELYLGQLKTPDAYAGTPAEATTLFCGRFEQLLAWESQVRTFRLVIAEADRVPGSAAHYFEAIFTTTADRLADYLGTTCGFDDERSSALARALLEDAALPRLFRALLRVEDAVTGELPPTPSTLPDDVDLETIRTRVAASGIT
ncbi:MAG TPA: TetR/AcrR family transcriptional regulator [Luteimicrobium sp.]|nr:TetR/AcrR family transcriptional regulator [Luteimicrobium sp.]